MIDERDFFFSSTEMSDLVRCVFYYGSGTVRINEQGADYRLDVLF